MSEQNLPELVNELAAAVVLADGDEESFGQVGTLVEALGWLLTQSDESVLSRLAAETGALLQAEAGADDRAQGLALAALLVEELQRIDLSSLRAAASEPGSPAAVAPDTAPAVRDDETLELIGDFLSEAEESLSRADELLLQGERNGFDAEPVNELFRIFHTLKGLAGHLAEGVDIAALAHQTESLLDLVRSGALKLEGAALEALFGSIVALRRLLAELRSAVDAGRPMLAAQDLVPVLARIDEVLRQGDGASTAEASAGEGTASDEEALFDEASPLEPGAAAKGGHKLQETLRVNLGRVDSLVEMIGELVIVESMVAHAPEIAAVSSPKVRNYLGQLRRISRDLQDAAMRLRMVPVRAVFARMRRLVRELARKSGKQAVLEISGDGTEMDRSMVEALEQPLVHLLRNAIDHGVESPEERARLGKPATAVLRLSAFHQGGNIVVELSDDGGGLRRAAIVRKARALGLLAEGSAPSESEIDNLIFAPGFSTAGAVTEISGRGVGLDAVKRGIELMRGRVAVSSQEGEGTTFRLVLPLTLAIIDGMLVACGEERYIVPSLTIVEAMQVQPEALFSMANREELLRVRDEVVPVVRLGRLLEVPGRAGDERPVAVLVESMGRRLALLVDGVVAQQQVVIKPLGDGVGHAELLSGAAILSDGRVGLILNVDRICSHFSRSSFTAGERRPQEMSE